MNVYDCNSIFITDQSITSTVTSSLYTLSQLSEGSSYITSKVEMSTSLSTEVFITILQTNTVSSTSSDIPYPDVTKSLLNNPMQKTLLTLNATNVAHSTANLVITASPCLSYNSDNDEGVYLAT